MQRVKLYSRTESDLYALVDDEDYADILAVARRWHLNKGYATTAVVISRCRYIYPRRRTFFMHRLIIPPPPGLFIDHINHNKLDNRKENLRICTRQQNQFNRLPQSGSGGFKGVTRVRGSRKWLAGIGINNRHHRIGLYEDVIEAARAYNAAAAAIFGEFAYLNEVE